MYKIPALILTAALVLNAAGCSMQKNAKEETAKSAMEDVSVSEMQGAGATAAGQTEQVKKYPETLETEILLEGTPEKMVMDLFEGEKYVIYIPQDEWISETPPEKEFPADSWHFVFNEAIRLSVVSFGVLTPEEAEAWIRSGKEQCTFEQIREGYFSGIDLKNNCFLEFMICSDGEETFAVEAEYPLEAGDGFAPRISAMMETFEMKQ